jgi:hypothetical protein
VALIGNPPEQRSTKMTTSKIALVALGLSISITSSALADQTDLMLVQIKNDKGQLSLHNQAVSHNSCSVLLEELRKTTVILTMRNPYAKGSVVEAHCFLPDGSRLSWPAN